jgi:hypothetical protein
MRLRMNFMFRCRPKHHGSERRKLSRITIDSGIALFERIGIDVAALTASRGQSARVLCRPCLDWSERRAHLAGALGAALCTRSIDQGWISHIAGTRAVTVTPAGWRIYHDMIGIVSLR